MAERFARLLLADGPLAGQEVALLPPDVAAPVQVVWSSWPHHGCLYEWRGEQSLVDGRLDALLFRWTRRRVGPRSLPVVMSQMAELWADAADLIVVSLDMPAEAIWPGL